MPIRSTLLSTLLAKLGLTSPGGILKFLALIYALLNLKNLPFAWHLRLLHGLLTHLRTSHHRLSAFPGPRTLFLPIITSSRSGFYECDYNLHKSNSTYFSDFDVGRLDLLVSLCSAGMAKVEADLAPEGGGGGGRGGGGKAATGGVKVMLGGVGMHFHREIKPYEGFEVWTRVLCWDRKWVYLVGHFVRKGAVRPTTHILQPWRRGRERAGKGGGGEKEEEEEKGDGVFASGIAKYVFKHGRRTIPPERILRASELLPPAPTVGEEGSDIITTSTSTTPPTLATTAENLPLHPPSESAEDAITASLTTAAGEEGTEWTWERVEAERKRGLRIAETYNALDGLKSEFTGKRGMALGRY